MKKKEKGRAADVGGLGWIWCALRGLFDASLRRGGGNGCGVHFYTLENIVCYSRINGVA